LASAAAGARTVEAAPTGALAFSLGYARDIDAGRGAPRWISVTDLARSSTKAITPVRPKGSRRADSDVALSPDGRRIAFFRRGPRAGLYVASVDGSSLRRVAAGDAARLPPDGPPVWSPDGRKIAFALVGPTCPLKTPRNAGIYVVRSTGGGLRKLPALTRSGRSWPSFIRVDAWSSDGRTVLYTEFQFGGDCRGIACCNSTVLELKIGGRHPSVVADLGGAFVYARGVGWSADGTIIAYQECSGDACDVVMRRGNEKWVVDPDYEDVEAPDLWGDIRWAPTGHKLASLARFKSNEFNEAGDLELDVIDFDLKTVRQLSVIRTNWGEAGLAWSADARRVVVAASSPVDVYSAQVDGSALSRIGRLYFSKGVTYDSASLYVG
jgi:hypothetical protein